MVSRRALVTVLLLAVVYVGSYLALSRRGFEESRRTNMRGFYFSRPRDSALWRWSNYGCVVFYYPLILADYHCGTGMVPAKEPLWGLSK